MVTRNTHNESSRLLIRLAESYGVQTSYRDDRGRVRHASDHSLLDVLAALGADVAGSGEPDAPKAEAAMAKAINEREAAVWARPIEPVLVAWEGVLSEQLLRLPWSASAAEIGAAAVLEMTLEDGSVARGEVRLEDARLLQAARVAGRDMVAVTLPAGTVHRALFPGAVRLPWGYHRLRVEVQGIAGEALLISTPRRCWLPKEGEEAIEPRSAAGRPALDVPPADPADPLRGLAGRRWGVFAPVYALRSARDWGAGDLADLRALAGWTETRGGSFVATLPLLASRFGKKADPSPYRPLSRLFWNEFYLAPEDTDEWARCEPARRCREAAGDRRETLRAQDLVDYEAVMALKRSVLEELARCFFERASGDERQRYEHYLAENPLVREYAAFRAETADEPGGTRPAPARDSGGRAAEERFHLYCQWQMERQLAALSAAHGLLLDLPLGVHPEGFDARRWPGVLVSGASTGAPPDSFFTGGQDWCSPPLHPEADRTAGYAYFRACLANLMRPASVLRIDHVMSLHRLFWIPEGAHPRDGVYVTYPAEEMYALLSCESHRHHTEIVGEDLGTVPPGVRTRMRSHALARTWIYVWSLRPRAALMTAAVPPDSLATLGTHDMVPLAGFLEGDDIQIRVETGQLAPEEAYRESARRSRLVDRLSAGLRAPEAGPGRAAAILAGALAYLGRSAARMVLVNLEDLLLERRPQNVPGTALERPNWRRKIAVTIEQLPDYSDARK